MRYIVYGAGGIGGPLGAYLWETGLETLLIARGSHLERIQTDGLSLVTPALEARFTPTCVGTSPCAAYPSA